MLYINITLIYSTDGSTDGSAEYAEYNKFFEFNVV